MAAPAPSTRFFSSYTTTPFPGQTGTAYLIPHPTFRPDQLMRRVVFTVDEGKFQGKYRTTDERPIDGDHWLSVSPFLKEQFLAQRRQPHPDNANSQTTPQHIACWRGTYPGV